MCKTSILKALGLSLLLGLSPLAAEPVIQRGIDVFTTPADGRTYYSFAKNPIPAGFFCKGSRAFTGRVAFRGVPLVAEPQGQLRGGDTVIERLDDAVLDAKGLGKTRIQFRALSLVSIEPLETSCGAYHVNVSLGGAQRVTAMSIHKTKKGGGTFVAPLAVNARLTFIPVKPSKAARKLELTGSFTFPPKPLPWSLNNEETAKTISPVVVDTDGDQAPDTLFLSNSNFAPGQLLGISPSDKYWGCCLTCHAYSDEKSHCYFTAGCEMMQPVICME